MKLFFSLAILSYAFGATHADGLRNGDQGKPPSFVEDGDLPPGLVDNPSEVVGVKFKNGRKPQIQALPEIAKGRPATILGVDGRPIKLDISSAERVNIFNPEKFELSADGTFVTNKVTGETITLNYFYAEDKVQGTEISFALDDDGKLFNARVAKKVTPKEKENPHRPPRVQNFVRVEESDVLAAYVDDDVDYAQYAAFGEDPMPSESKELPPGAPELEIPQTNANGKTENKFGGNRKLQKANYARTAYGKTCYGFDWLDVSIMTDTLFKNRYYYHQSRAQAIFAEAAEIFWKESCVQLYMLDYTHADPTWEYWAQYYGGHSGCGSTYGALDLLKWFGTYVYTDPLWERNAMHLFGGRDFSDGSVIGCAFYSNCNKDLGYGVNHMTFTSDLRLQAVLFAHELGHNLDLPHLPNTYGYWVMEPIINSAPYDLNPGNADTVKNKILGRTDCGWY